MARFGLGLGLVIVLLVGACTGARPAPLSVQPTLDAVRGLGYDCDDGIADNVPSGLSQWRCEDELAGHSSIIFVDGADQGVTSVSVFVDDPDPAITRTTFAQIAKSVPPVTAASVLPFWLSNWSGAELQKAGAGVSLSAACEPTYCVVTIANELDGLKPLPVH